MDITGGTQSSGGLFSPSNASKRNTIYDPSYHRWMTSKSTQGRNTLTANTIIPPKPTNRYTQVSDDIGEFNKDCQCCHQGELGAKTCTMVR